jgi:hypothetical protein
MRYDFALMQSAPRYLITASRSLLQRYLLGLLVLGLLWLPLAGKLHQVAHSSQVEHHSLHNANPAFEKLFSHHFPSPAKHGSLDCQVFEAHCFGLALSKAIPALPVSAAQQELAVRSASTKAWSQERLRPEARAPPSLI